MGKIYNNVYELIGNTPLVELKHIEEKYDLNCRILAKLEYLNPAGSVKDRIALAMIEDAEKKGLLNPGSMIIEPTSGNTGIGLAAMGISRGYQVVLTMPETMSSERCNLLRAYGAKLVLTDGSLGMAGAVERAEELHKAYPNSIIAGQFDNLANTECHYQTTGPEIWKDTEGAVDIVVAGVGTGGTLSGVAQYLKEQNPSVQVVAVEPEASPLLSKGRSGSHGIQGIGANFIPGNLNLKLCDEIYTVGDMEAMNWARTLAKTEGILVGISAGAAMCAAVGLAQRPENKGKNIVVIFPDSGDRYYSTALFI